MYRPVLVTAPVIKPVTLAEAKVHLRQDFSDQDTLITALIDATVSTLDGWTGTLGRCLCQQQWRQDFDSFYGDSREGFHDRLQARHPAHAAQFRPHLRLPLYPVIGIVSVTYIDLANVAQTIAAENYTLRDDEQGCYVEFIPTYVFPQHAAVSAAVSVTYNAGYADAVDGDSKTSTVPEALRQAMLLRISHWFENREAVVVSESRSVGAIPLPFAVDALEGPFRRRRF